MLQPICPAVAETSGAHDRDFEVARERVVLKTVVADDEVHFGVEFEELLRGAVAVARDRDGRLRFLRDEKGFVTGEQRVGVGRHETNVVFGTAVAAGDDAGRPALFPQGPYERDRDGGLPRAAHVDVSHDHHGNGNALGDALAALPFAHRAKYEGKGREKNRNESPVGPGSMEPGFYLCAHGVGAARTDRARNAPERRKR